MALVLLTGASILWASRGVAAESTEASIALYADAANSQTGGAIELAIKNWTQFLKQYPDDDLASKAAHYLGVCYMQKEDPDYVAAAKAFTLALEDTEYELREESLANQGWCYYASAGDGPERDQEKLKQTLATFEKLRDENPRSDYIDRAYFYSGEAAYGLGDRVKAVKLYNAFLDLPEAKDSPLRCDAFYARGIALEELKKNDLAVESFQQLLRECADNPLAVDVHLRLGDLMILRREYADAVKSFDLAISMAKSDADKSYAVFRQAYALVQSGQPGQAAVKYDRLQSDFPDSPYAANAMLASGQSFYRDGDRSKAAARFETVLTQNNPVAATEAAHWLARIRLASGEAAAAVKVARQQISSGAQGEFALDLKLDLAEALSLEPSTIEESIEIAEQAYREAPDDSLAPRALYNAAFSSLQLNQYDRAGKLADEFLKRFDSNELSADVRFILAESQLLSAKPDQAVQNYRKLLQDSEPDHPQRSLWVLRAAVALNSTKQYQETIQLVRAESEAMKQPAQQAEAQFLVGQAELMSDQYTDAARSFGKSVQADPTWKRAAEARLLQGTAYLTAGDSGQAEQTWMALIQSSGESAMADQARYKLAQAASNAGEHETAIGLYDEILAADRDKGLLPYANYGKGWSLMQSGQHEPAISSFGTILDAETTHPLSDDALIARGICRRTLGQTDAAATDLNQYLKLKPTGTNLGHALYELALVDQKQDRSAEAAAGLERLVREVPDYPDMDKVLYELGWALRDSKKEDEAAERFEQLLDRYPDTDSASEAAYFIGQRRYGAKDWDSAEKYFRIAADRAVDDSMGEKSLYRLGWTLFKKNDLQQAQKAFAGQAEKHPDGRLAIDARMMVGECLFKGGNYKAALQSYAKGREKIQAADENADSLRDPAERQVRELILLHGGQSAAQIKQWDEAIGWYDELKQRFSRNRLPASSVLRERFCLPAERR